MSLEDYLSYFFVNELRFLPSEISPRRIIHLFLKEFRVYSLKTTSVLKNIT